MTLERKDDHRPRTASKVRTDEDNFATFIGVDYQLKDEHALRSAVTDGKTDIAAIAPNVPAQQLLSFCVMLQMQHLVSNKGAQIITRTDTGYTLNVTGADEAGFHHIFPEGLSQSPIPGCAVKIRKRILDPNTLPR